MLDKLKTFSIKLSPIQPLFLFIALGGFAVFLTTLFKLSDMVKESYLIPSGVAALWALSAWVIISTFQHVPEITPSLGIFKRTKDRIVRLFFYLITLGFIGLSGFILFVTLRMFSIWYRY
ncbi:MULTISPECIES: hypothetical protein [unclassified Vibrio]|uniref:hypothetical protein n=1 Tax=unclassified Vibrio TaxID=2614977 RepID=UPI002554337B|nr:MULTISPECIES: hypothetical protein [unclassified Vibrio]MDK9777183.1 hypothetical protein [Vibrio sp. D401a]MDK9806679.1 hypothetical protein [Vibrio sp. D406a]